MKFVLLDEGHIFMLTSDPKYKKFEIQKHSISCSAAADLNVNNTVKDIRLDVLVLNDKCTEHFKNRDQPVLIKDIIYIKGAKNKVLAIK